MKIKINYFYFGFFFLCLAILHLQHLFLIESGVSKEHLFFTIDILAQVFLETLCLTLLAGCLSTYLHPAASRIFTFSTFLLLLARIIEFPLLRLMDISIWFGIHLLLDEPWENFLEMLYATSITLQTWLLIAVIVALIFFIGIWVCYITEKLSNKKRLLLSPISITQILCIGTLSLLGWNTYTTQHTSFHLGEKLKKALPWKSTLSLPKYHIIHLAGSLKALEEEQVILTKLESYPLTPHKKPDIFLFIIESLREDFINPITTPHLHAFKQQHSIEHLSFSNANATQLAWFSIFNSKYPFYWEEMQKCSKKRGALPLHILKKLGYQIHVHSSSRLTFYQMKELLFGEDNHLLSSFTEYLPDNNRPIWQCDEKVIASLNQHLLAPHPQTGRLFITFLESTHFDYSWPQNMMTQFSPITQKIDFLQTAIFKPKLELIINRYRNAVHYVDHLLGQFLTQLENRSDEQAVVVITGDHGEEFFEEGHLFHASNLNEAQTRVPIYYNLKGLNSRITSHMDIFPTLLHHVVGEDRFCDFFEGNSLFKQQKNPFIVTGRYNASRSPSEFFIHNGQFKLRAQFRDPTSILQCKHLQILSFEDQGIPLPFKSDHIQEVLGPSLTNLFTH